jgi:ketopantoate reductase
MAAANQASSVRSYTVLLFGNFARMMGDLAAALGHERTIAGFPGVGGRIDDEAVSYVLFTQQPTIVGELGTSSGRAQAVADPLRGAGFPTNLEARVDEWLASHAALVVPVTASIVAAGGTAAEVVKRKDLLQVATDATRTLVRTQQRSSHLVIDRKRAASSPRDAQVVLRLLLVPSAP